MARRFVGVTLVGVVTAEDEEEVTHVLDRGKIYYTLFAYIAT